MRHALLSLLAASALALLAAPAAASSQATFIAPGSGSATLDCNGAIGPTAGSGVVHAAATCTEVAVGTSVGAATAAPGHLQVKTRADSHNGDSLSAQIGASATFADDITFTSTDPLATTASVAAEVFLDGTLAGAINGGGQIRAFVSFAGADFDLRQGFSQNGPFGAINTGWVFEGGQLGAATDLHMRTGFVTVPLNTPVPFFMLMDANAFASGPGALGLSDFGLNSFKFAATPFLLGAGITADAGDYIVHNRFIDPLASAPGGVPEPATWVLSITGFGLAGARLRGRQAAPGRP